MNNYYYYTNLTSIIWLWVDEMNAQCTVCVVFIQYFGINVFLFKRTEVCFRVYTLKVCIQTCFSYIILP